MDVLTKEPRAFFTAIGLKLSEISYALMAGIFAINYVTVKLAMPRSVILTAVFVSSVVALIAIPLFGWLSDRIGRKTMFYASSLFAMAFAFPFFWLLDTKDPLIITLTIVADRRTNDRVRGSGRHGIRNCLPPRGATAAPPLVSRSGRRSAGV